MCVDNRLIYSWCICIFLFVACTSEARDTKPLIWDLNKLEQMRENLTTDEVRVIIGDADRYCMQAPVVITDNKMLFQPNNHYYCSVGQYWWPDSLQNGKYVNKDGEINPESREYDIVRLEDLSKRCSTLSQAFYLTRDTKYYRAFIEQLDAWFLNKETLMLPNFEYAQVVPGYHDNKGRSAGMIDAYYFNSVIEGIRLVNGVKRIDGKTLNAVRRWFRSFADWSEYTHGDVMKTGTQNISLAYDVMVVNMYLFAGKIKKAKKIADDFAARRIYTQIKDDGSQPEELKRTNAMTYSLYNLTHILDFCYLVRYWDKDYYSKYGERIDTAFSYLQKYIDHPDAFPYQQIRQWKSCQNTFNVQNKRREVIKSLASN